VRQREWIRCKDIERMLHDVMAPMPCPDAIHARRLRLFVLAAGRRLWASLGDEVCSSAVAVAWR
jgi:hypothetical protein